MIPCTDQYFAECFNHVCVSNLPPDINARRIIDVFQEFGNIPKLYLKRRVSKYSPIFLTNPFVILIFERPESVNKVMANRPYFMDDHPLFVRRCLPMTGRYPYEKYFITNKILLRISRGHPDEVLPNDEVIRDYLKTAGGKILRLERFEEQTILVEFDDYDTVDICCMKQPHLINGQMIEIEKCRNEEQARHYARFRQNSRCAPVSTTEDTDVQISTTTSSTSILNNDEPFAELQLRYGEISSRLEAEHEQLVLSLKGEWEQIVKERIRLQRLTLDYKQEYQRLLEENRQLEKLSMEEIQEGLRIQNKDK